MNDEFGFFSLRMEGDGEYTFPPSIKKKYVGEMNDGMYGLF